MIVRDGAVIARAGNRTIELDDPTAHAEMLAIRAAAAAVGSQRLDRRRPLRHARALRDVRGGDLVRAHPAALFRRADAKGGAVENGVRFFAQPTCHHAPEVYGGIAESEAAAHAQGFLPGAPLSRASSENHCHGHLNFFFFFGLSMISTGAFGSGAR